MTIKRSEGGWVRLTFTGLDFEEYPRYSVRHGEMIPDHPALPAVAEWLQVHGEDGLHALRYAILCYPQGPASQMRREYDALDALIAALEGVG